MASEFNPQSTTLTAFFEDRDDAEESVSRLRELNVPEASIRLVAGAGEGAHVDHEKGFWESLSDFFFPDEDRAAYAEGLRRGGFLVTVTGLSREQYDQALDILDDEGSVDVGERAETWRSEGWLSTGSAAAGAGTFRGVNPPTGASVDEGIGSGVTSTLARGSGTSSRSEDEVIPVIKEDIRVGKRDVSLGRVRVRSYVVEAPVTEQVNLRDDRVHIERTPVDRPVQDGDRMFTDKVLEAEEHTQEAVISKEARVTEDIGLRRVAEDRSETVSDTVRHTEVEIEDERTQQLRRDNPARR
jgi:stress response protein YsnF